MRRAENRGQPYRAKSRRWPLLRAYAGGWLMAACLAVPGAIPSKGEAASLSDDLREAASAADPTSVPVLRVLDSEGDVRWQLPMVLWVAPRAEIGGYSYPCAVPLAEALSIKGPLVFVGYGLTRDDWDDYGGKRIEGSVAVVFNGLPRLGPSMDRAAPREPEIWVELIQEKVHNAQSHGAIAVLLERNPLLPPCQDDFLLYPKKIADLPMAAPTICCWGAGDLPLPTLSIGTRTLEVVVAHSSDLFHSGITTGNLSLRYLTEDCESQRRGLGPIPLGLWGEVSWTGGQLRKQQGERCNVWYQPGSPAARDIEHLVLVCDDAIGNLESLLSARLDEPVTILLFADWRSKLICTATLGWGHASGARMVMVYEGGGGEGSSTLVHEMCHLVAGTIGSPPAAFDEGLARLVGNTLGALHLVPCGPVEADLTTAANLRQGDLWSLRELLDIPGSEWGTPPRRPIVSYPEAASFCAYLIRRIGFDGFRDLYRSLTSADLRQNVELIEKAAKCGLDKLEADWHSYLRGLES